MNNQGNEPGYERNPFAPIDFKKALWGAKGDEASSAQEAPFGESADNTYPQTATPYPQEPYSCSVPAFDNASAGDLLSQRMALAENQPMQNQVPIVPGTDRGVSPYDAQEDSLRNRLGYVQDVPAGTAPIYPEESGGNTPFYTQYVFETPPVIPQETEPQQPFTDSMQENPVPTEYPAEAFQQQAAKTKAEKPPKTALTYVLYAIAGILAILIAVFGIRLLRNLYIADKSNSSASLSGNRVELPADGSPIAVSPVSSSAGISSAVVTATEREESFSTLRSARKSYPDNPQMYVLSAVATCQKENSDIVGQLSISSLLDEPILHGTSFLDTNERGVSDGSGCICTKDDCRFNIPPENLTLYGRAETADDVFTPVAFQLDAGSFEPLLYAHLLTPYEEKDYVLLVICPGQNSIPDSFSTDDEMSGWLRNMFSQSITVVNSDVRSTDSLLTLQLLGSSEQYTLIYRMLRDGESKAR